MQSLLPLPALHVPAEAAESLGEYVAGQEKWFHTFLFSNGLQTPGYDPSARKLRHLMLPDRLDGYSVLDIGAYDGYFSFHAAQRGATKVVASDDFVWRLEGVPARENLATVRRHIGAYVDDIEAPVEALRDVFNEQFDLTLFLGVLYHAPDMLGYLKQAFACTRSVCVIETLVDHLDIETPSVAYYPPGSLNGDPSNVFGPNITAVISMCERAGFSRCELINLWDVNTRAQIEGKGKLGALRSGRAVFHAYR